MQKDPGPGAHAVKTPPPFDVAAAHRWFAARLNNRTWELLESPDRSADESEEMVHAAHAACHHWREVGTVAHQARAECLLANVYAALRRGSSALRHAGRCVDLTEAHAGDMTDWDLAFAYDCLARATAASGSAEEARGLKRRARDAGDAIAEAEERSMFDRWFAAGNWHGIDDAD